MSVRVETIREELPRILLENKKYFPPRFGVNFSQIIYLEEPSSEERLHHIVQECYRSKYLVVDLETRGSDYSQIKENLKPEIVMIGLAWDTGSCSFDWCNRSSSQHNLIRELLKCHPGLIAHNVYFDGGFIYTQILENKHANWRYCTYSLLAMLENEGYPGDSWSLKRAMVDLLGWESSNETELDRWLVRSGHYLGNRRIRTDSEYLEQEWQLGKIRPKKEEMWRAPTDILGKYCALDAEATYLLLTEILLPALSKFPALEKFYFNYFLKHILNHIEQKIVGIKINTNKLRERTISIEAELSHLYTELCCKPETAQHIESLNCALKEEAIGEEPSKFKRKPKIGGEPLKITKKGEISKSWIRWSERVQLIESTEAEISKTWDNWNEKKQSILKENIVQFNWNSGDQLGELLYARLGFPVRLRSEKTNKPSVSMKAFSKIGGRIGEILIQKTKLMKELGYLHNYRELLETGQRDTIHAGFLLPGTMTGRLAGKEPNLMQISKTKEMLGLFVANPGEIWVDLDFSSVESVIAAEFTGDTNLRFLFNNPDKINDMHLFLGAHVPGRVGEQIRATGYDPFDPHTNTIAKAKKECKKLRSIVKTCVYLLQYGGGVGRLQASLEEDGISLSRDEIELVYNTYWTTFSEIKPFIYKLELEWYSRGGYILNGLGRPMAVGERDKKDLFSRFVQSTAHDLLVMYSVDLMEISINAKGRPVVLDLHDAVTLGFPQYRENQALDLFRQCLLRLNREIRGDIPIRGEPVSGRDLAEVKEAE